MTEILDDTKEDQQPKFEFKPHAIIIWMSFVVIGLFFDLLHWAGASILIVTASGGTTAYSLSAIIRLKGTHMLNNIVSILCGIWISVFLWGIIFNGGYPYNIKGLMVFGVVFLMAFGINELVFRLQGK